MYHGKDRTILPKMVSKGAELSNDLMTLSHVVSNKSGRHNRASTGSASGMSTLPGIYQVLLLYRYLEIESDIR